VYSGNFLIKNGFYEQAILKKNIFTAARKHMMKHYSLLFLFLISGLVSEAQAPKYSNEFLAIGTGARAKAMGNSFVAIADDATAGYWNPSGLLRVEGDLQISLMHAEYFAGIAKYDFGAIAFPIDTMSTIAFTYIRFGVDDIPNTSQLIDAEGNINYDRVTSFSTADNAFLFSYARKMKIPGLSLGANVKVVRRIIGNFANSWGFGLDVSAQYQKNDWLFGAVFRDVTGTFNAWNYTLDDDFIEVLERTGNELPSNGLEVTVPKLILGGAWGHAMGKSFSFLAELDMDLTFDGKRNTLISSDFVSIDPHAGVEIGYKNVVFIRLGVNSFQFETDQFDKKSLKVDPSLGLGLRLGNFYLDYALTNIGSASGTLYSNVFSLKFDIYKKNKA
jgi:hypothetical protein